MRLLSNESFVDNKKLTTGSLTDEDWERRWRWPPPP